MKTLFSLICYVSSGWAIWNACRALEPPRAPHIIRALLWAVLAAASLYLHGSV